MNIFVGNLSREITADDLKTAFEAYGKVTNAKLIKDMYSGESRGFAFIEMPVNDEAKAAISGMNGKEMGGKILNVNEARPRSNSGNRSGGKRSGGRRRY